MKSTEPEAAEASSVSLQMTLACRVPSDATFFLMHENLSEYLKVQGIVLFGILLTRTR